MGPRLFLVRTSEVPFDNQRDAQIPPCPVSGRGGQDFLNKLAPGDTAAFYFAGHGVEFGGRSYLLPRDVPSLKTGRDELLRREALSLQEFLLEFLLDLREKGTRLNLAVVDACRDNPFEQVKGRSVGSRRGLAVAEPPPEGTFIMYSAGAGESALDRLDDADSNPNSVYTRHLLRLLRTPGLTLADVAKQVRVAVREVAATVQHVQTPAYYDQVVGRVCLAGGDCSLRGANASAAAGPSASAAEAQAAWPVIKDTASLPALEAFIRRFGDTYYGDLAKLRLAELKAEAERPLPTPLKAEEDRRAEEARKRPGWEFVDCPDVCPTMVVVPAGSFTMGSNERDDEKPPHRVTIKPPFAVGKFEVMFAEWNACVAGGGCRSNRTPDDGGWGKGRRPVIGVSWDDAREYVSWLSRKTGKAYRLLSEAEWEYAARAGTTTDYAFGDTLSKGQAHFSEGHVTSAGKTVEVGSFAANRFGLHDLHGNVWEWVEDDWHPNYQGAPLDGSVWQKGEVPSRVLRGGAWNLSSENLRSAARVGFHRDHRDYNVGFRVARTL